MPDKPHICIIAPCFNEQAVITIFYERLTSVLSAIPEISYELIFVDDGSSDGTLAILNRLSTTDDRLNVLSLSRNFGHQIALTAGIDHANADAIVLMDSDLQHPPELLPAMIKRWQTDNADIVSAVRQYTLGVSFLKNLTSSLFYAILNLLSDINVKRGAADFCLLNQRAQLALRSMPERHRFLRGMISWIGYRRIYLPYHAGKRVAGVSKYSRKKMLAFAFDAAFSFSAAPIKLATRLGIGIMIFGCVYFVYVLIRAFFFGDLVQGWGSLMSVVLILGGLNFMLVGLIGGYLGRVYEEVKRRPLYVLKQGLKTRITQ
jgi:polyisoprenyl-phosphate glycosyltransferase